MTDTPVTIEGYAAVFGVPDLTGDVIRRGAFDVARKLIPAQASHVMMLYQHTAEEPIGVWTDLEEDEHGLWVRGQISQSTQRGRETAALVGSGVLTGLSIGFKPRRVRRRPGGGRDLLSVELWEISVVTFPMAPGARITPPTGNRVRTPRNLLSS